MNKVMQDELIDEIKGLLLRKYPDYVFKEIFKYEDVNFPGAIRITIFFWDMENQRKLWVSLVLSITDLLTAPSAFLIESLINRIDSKLKKFKEENHDL